MVVLQFPWTRGAVEAESKKELVMPEKTTKETDFLFNSEMGLGAWSWGDRLFWNYGHGYTDADIEAAFQTSLDAGVSLVDTAEVYGQGKSERLLGGFLKSTQTKVFVATKFFPYPWRLSRRAVARALHRSLERLGLDKVDLYQIHQPFPPVAVETWAEGLAEVVKAGLTRSVGVSNYNKNQMQRVYTVLAKYEIPLASNQVEYHLLDRSIEKDGLLDRCKELGVRLIAYSPLAMGMLTGKYNPENPPPGLRGRRYGSLVKEIQPLIALMKEIGKEHGEKNPGQVALNWTICKGTLPIPGAKTATQAAQNAAALGWRLTSEQVKALDDASDKIGA
jgi:aryl-alcohol dehydrogenase-like predicted oxidoreductase